MLTRKRLLLLLIPIALLAAAGAYSAFSRSQTKPWIGSDYERECEYAKNVSTEEVAERSNASGHKVLARFGAEKAAPWGADEGSVWYYDITTPQLDRVYLKLRYSKDTPATVPILVYIDYELSPRATIDLVDQHSWDTFTWTDPIPLGPVSSGSHFLRLTTDGQENGVADLDEILLTTNAP